ncbi:TPA: hypothetical protein ACN7HJ_005294, partial [Klebsiella pneumoniae]
KKKQSFILIGINLAIVSVFLILNYTMYISLVELILIVISFTLFVILLENLDLKTKFRLPFNLIVSAIYLSLLVLSDLTLDHFTFSLFENGIEDGRGLSLLETISEFKNDAFFLLLILLALYFIAYLLFNNRSRQKETN